MIEWKNILKFFSLTNFDSQLSSFRLIASLRKADNSAGNLKIIGENNFTKNFKYTYCGKRNDFKKEALAVEYTGLPYTFEFCGEFICNVFKGEK